MIYSTGWFPDAPDGRDYKYSTIRQIATKNIPNDGDLRPLMPYVEEQRPHNSCVAHALTSALEFLQKKKGKKSENDRSRMFVYYNARLYDHLEEKDEGCVIRSAIKSVVELGVCSESRWPYISTNVFKTPPSDIYKRAKRQLLSDYYRIDSGNVIDIKAALAEGYPVIFGIVLYRSFMQTTKNGIISMPLDEPYVGRHAMLICGFSGYNFIVQNSWGLKWGDKGYCYLPFDYITKYASLGSDFWVVRKVGKNAKNPT